MKIVTIEVNKANVYDAVDETTAFIGAKMLEDDSAYDRISTIDADRTMLEHFWSEACSLATSALKPFINDVNAHPVSHTVELALNYEAKLKVSTLYDDSLTNGIETSLFSFFVNYIVGKWCEFTNKGEASAYLTSATSMLQDAVGNIYHRRRPERGEN